MKKTAEKPLSTSHGKTEAVMYPRWGAQTQQAIDNFRIGEEKMPRSFIRALGIVKRCAALANIAEQQIEPVIGQAIADASLAVIEGQMDEHFPLSVWQSGSGTQTHMNANEVIASLSSEQLKQTIHPNDHCNLGQSTNDSFPSAMHIACVEQVHWRLLPALQECYKTLNDKAAQWQSIIKIGRTHLQDATPLTLGQQFAAYSEQMLFNINRLEASVKQLYPLPQGGTAVGSGLNTTSGFAERFILELNQFTGLEFTVAPEKLALQAAHDPLVNLSGSMNLLAVSLNKIAGDIRLLGSGPRCGLGELRLPENEAGSSIMPGKVNPTQCEALMMVCVQVMGNHTTVTFAGAQGQLELNAYKPVILFNCLQSIRLLGDAIHSFSQFCLKCIEPDIRQINVHLQNSLMLVTALAPVIGYDQAALIAQTAYQQGITLKDAALATGLISEQAFDETMQIEKLIQPHKSQ